MPNRFNPAELALRDTAEKVVREAREARTDVDPVCLGRLRGLERRFHYALDLDRTLPNQIGIMKKFGDQALHLDIVYDKMIHENQNASEVARKNLDTNYKLLALHSIVALGKACEVLLALFPATSKLGEVLNEFKKGASSTKDLIEASRASSAGDKSGKTLEGLLKQLGAQGEALADLIGGIVDVGGGRIKVRRSNPRNWLEERQTSSNLSRARQIP